MQTKSRVAGFAFVLLALPSICCAGRRQPASAAPTPTSSGMSTLQVQAIVMEMADDYIAALGEAIYLIPQDVRRDPRARWLLQSFLRNGVGASVDIASGPNPEVALLDMVVLVSLQSWAFETRWTTAGIGREQALGTMRKLQDAEQQTWESAGRVLSAEQQTNLRELIAEWIENNPDRVVVSFVRFDDFTDARMIGNRAAQRKASGLLSQVRGATVAVEDARLFGERLIWFAGRYPYILGEQAELTAYRLADQPESRALVETLDETRAMARALASALDRLDDQRQATIEQAEASLERVSRAVTDRAFERLRDERTAVLNELEARQDELGSVLQELGRTIHGSTALAEELTTTVGALDHLVARFDRDPESGREPLDLGEVRDALAEAARTVEQLSVLLERADHTLMSDAWDDRIQGLGRLSDGLVDRAFHRGLTLVAVLLLGLAAIRLIPNRERRSAARPR